MWVYPYTHAPTYPQTLFDGNSAHPRGEGDIQERLRGVEAQADVGAAGGCEPRGQADLRPAGVNGATDGGLGRQVKRDRAEASIDIGLDGRYSRQGDRRLPQAGADVKCGE